MEEYILFSPVGGTDPIANGYDGAILHICRVYKPCKVYLYMSRDIIEKHEHDNRYVYCLEKLISYLDIKMDIEIIKKEELIDVQKFDIFYSEYEKILDGIAIANPKAKIILNISSGTPAMKSALTVISVTGRRDYLSVQVAHPQRTMSAHIEDRNDYLPELQWECNQDNQQDFMNRCEVYSGEPLLVKIKKEIIMKHIEAYDYCAALRIAKEIEAYVSIEVIKLLEAAVCRIQLNKSGVDKAIKDINYRMFPIDGTERLLFEYVLWLKIKMIREDYADFIRGITPFVVDIYEFYLTNMCKIDLKKKYYRESNYNGVMFYKLDESKLNQSEEGKSIVKILSNAFSKGYEFKSAVNSRTLLELLKAYCKDSSFLKACSVMEAIEPKVRNIAAHEIVSVNYQWICKQGGYTPEQIVDALEKLLSKACPRISEDMWSSYDQMNHKIIGLI